MGVCYRGAVVLGLPYKDIPKEFWDKQDEGFRKEYPDSCDEDDEIGEWELVEFSPLEVLPVYYDCPIENSLLYIWGQVSDDYSYEEIDPKDIPGQDLYEEFEELTGVKPKLYVSCNGW